MPDFDATRQQLRDARSARDQASAATAAARERLKAIDSKIAELKRVVTPDNDARTAQLGRLRSQRAGVEAETKRLAASHAAAVSAEVRQAADFAVFTDPRKNIERLDDSTPILLMPLRLETRFKTAAAVPGAPAPVNQLWVRVFPDDCCIDTFDPVLTGSEVQGGKAYWTSVWQAGGIADQEDSAWIALATTHGSGRAAWIVQQYRPVNLAAKPSKPHAEDVILTIAAETPLAAGEEPAVAAYWAALWLADGDAQKSADALNALKTALGDARAAEITTNYVPANFSAPLAPGATKDTVQVWVAQLVLPAVDTRQAAWSQSPKAVFLPDRFVFLGYETENDESPVVALSNPVPSPLITGPDPGAPPEDQIHNDADGNLVMPDELQWMADFDRAVELGMGFRINLTPTQASRGFKRVLVVGLRLNADVKSAQTELETLLRHHSYSRTGLALLPQGTPTNNTDAANSGFSHFDDPNQSLEDRRQPLFTPLSNWLDKKDGQWLAEYLGVDPGLFANTHQAGCSDQLTARAMNSALWPATLGYWMESMMSPAFSPAAVQQTREFFRRYVLGSGACPAIRIGFQPYGILPATTLSRMDWINRQPEPDNTALFAADPILAFLRRLYPILRAIQQDFRAKVPQISFVGKSGDPHASLLDIVGLHPGSVEWTQRYAESVRTFINRANLLGLAGLFEKLSLAIERINARDKLTALGYTGERAPAILDLIFNGAGNRLKGGVIDDAPLSEADPIRPGTADGRNYIEWLIDAAKTSLDALYAQQDFQNGKVPSALLYLFLRHALQLGYHDVSIRLFEAAGLYDANRALAARADDPFVHIRNNQQVSESRYQPLYAFEPAITGSPTVAVHEFIGSQLATISVARDLTVQLDAMERLKDKPTAQLERAFADHIDCCSYRLDAWLLGIVNYQLGLMRNLRDGSSAEARQGIYLGAYAWLEDVVPEDKVLAPVRLPDDLAAIFNAPGQPPLMRDSTNQGYIHAPSTNHAVAAAVLRNGFISDASPANRDTLAVNLTSERVRTALAMIEGIRAGQSLGDLLGYQLERGLHDRHNLAEVDKFIFKLRKAFPLRADRLKATKTGTDVDIGAIEARNVVNGLALVEHVKATGNKTYPFGIATLPPVDTQAQADAINAEVDRLLETHDAAADLALSEGVYQAVLGNYDRVASTYDAYARGNFPPEPDVIRTPLNGIGLTHRVALHLAAGASPAVSPVPGLAMTPRAQAEPALNQWINAVLPPLDQVACLVAFREAASGTNQLAQVTLRQLELQPADFLNLIRDDNQQAMTELDDRVSRFVADNLGPRPDVPVVIRYMEKDTAAFTVFEIMPLARNLRRITTRSRPLEPADLSLMNEARSTQNADVFVDKARLDTVRAALVALRTDLDAFKTALDAPLADLANRRPEVLANTDIYIADVANLLARAAAFAIPQSGWGFAYDFRRRNFAALLKLCADLVARWDQKLQDFDDRITEAAAAAGDEEKFALLDKAERAISTTLTVPRPATPAAYEAVLTGIKRPAFAAKRDQFAAVGGTTRTGLSLLRADIAALLPVTDFDFTGFDLAAVEDNMVRFAEDVSGVAKVVLNETDRRLSVSASLFNDHDNAAAAADKVKALDQAARALLGEDFRIFPEFGITSAQGDELANALAASQSGELFQYLTAPPGVGRDPLDFPVDTWLYGLARVREKMFAWEQTVTFCQALGRSEPRLDALQLPFTPGDRWMGLEFPPDLPLDKDRLLYTAHFAAPFNKNARQCGMLIDEWTETIPASTVDTGVAFHHDRPNCEAPQTMLLVTPSDFRGAWRWDDLVGALNETLDFAKLRAIEPKHIDDSPYAPFLPATVIATQVAQLTIALDLALNNRIELARTV